MENDPYETVNVWMRQSNLNPRQLIPALLRYDHKKLMEKATQVKERYLRRKCHYYLTYLCCGI
jgi:hypothetical protein